MFNKRSNEAKTKVRYGFSYGRTGERKSGNLSSISNVFYAKDKILGINKDNNKNSGHYCIPIKYHSDGTCDVVTLTSLSLYGDRYERMLRYYKKYERVKGTDVIPIEMNGRVFFIVKGKLRQVMNGTVRPISVRIDNSVWQGVNTQVIENVFVESLKETKIKRLLL